MPEIKLITTAHDHWQYEPSSNANLDEKTYRAVPALNPSALVAGIVDTGNPNPSAVKAAFESHDDNRTVAEKDRLAKGQLAHAMLLEPETVDGRFVAWEGGVRKGEVWELFNQKHIGKVIVKDADWEQTDKAIRELSKIDRLNELFLGKDCQHEVSLFGQWGSLYLKGRIDAGVLNDIQPRIPDFKTTEAGISDYEVERTCRMMKYREKTAFYQQLASQILGISPEAIEVYIVFAKMSPPYGLNIKKLTYDCYQFGWSRCEEVLKSVEFAVHHDRWPVWISDGFLGLSSFEAQDVEIGEAL